MPHPWEFYNRYSIADNGAGRPLVLRGAARRMAAMRWSDALLLAKHAAAKISSVEVGLKETRVGGLAGGHWKLADFLSLYNHSDIHLVSPVPSSMQREVELLPLLSCGGFANFLGTHRLWVARGGSRSVVHRDDAENINCLFAGKKQFALVHPSLRALAEKHPNSPSPPDRFGFLDTRLDPDVPGYGAFFGRLDVDAMDLIKFPGWKDVDWHRADLIAGDCIYIPHGWYHHVRAGPSRTVNAHVWYWRPEKFDSRSCERPAYIPGRHVRFSDCSWGYEPPPGGQPLGVRKHTATGSQRLRVTRCTPGGYHRARRRMRDEL